MTQTLDQKILAFNQAGIVPGPNESLEQYSRRADYCLSLKEHLSEELEAGQIGEINSDSSVLNPSIEALKTYYVIAPTWVPLFFSDYRLPFWHGGCAWIFQAKEDSPTSALIQLRQKFRRSSTYLGIYSRQELLTHELAHVARMAFQEPQYEEMLSYRTSPSAFRRLFGPIVQSSTESVIFILLLFMIIVFDVFLIATGRGDAYVMSLWLKLIPVSILGYGLLRVVRKQRRLNRCIENLEKCLRSITKAQAVAFRLTDAEIRTFSAMTPEGILDYARISSERELRWQVIMQAYFN